MNADLRKRLEEAAREYQEEYETTERVAFTHGAVWGYKEAIKVASEWWLKRLGGGQVSHDTDDIDDNGERVEICCEWTDTLCADFEADMNKLWEDEK